MCIVASYILKERILRIGKRYADRMMSNLVQNTKHLTHVDKSFWPVVSQETLTEGSCLETKVHDLGKIPRSYKTCYLLSCFSKQVKCIPQQQAVFLSNHILLCTHQFRCTKTIKIGLSPPNMNLTTGKFFRSFFQINFRKKNSYNRSELK